MSYAITLSPRARRRLNTVPKSLVQLVGEELLKLGSDPKRLGRKTVSPPFPPTIEHIYGFHLRYEEQLRYFTVFFLYVDDAQSLYVTNITVNPPFSDEPPQGPPSP
jgi:hypothetical protein